MTAPKKRLLLFVAALAGLVLLGARSWTGGQGRLLDGTSVVLRKVSYGTNSVSPESPLERVLRRLPARYQSMIHWSPSSRRTTDSPVAIFTFWLSFSSANAENQSITYALADENGFESQMLFTGYYGTYDPGGFSNNRSGLVR